MKKTVGKMKQNLLGKCPKGKVRTPRKEDDKDASHITDLQVSKCISCKFETKRKPYMTRSRLMGTFESQEWVKMKVVK